MHWKSESDLCREVKHNVVITGSTGCGKIFLACAFGHKACREGFSVVYRRVPRMLSELHIARGDGSLPRVLLDGPRPTSSSSTTLVSLRSTKKGREHLLEVIEDRHGERSTVIAGQLPVKDWHKYIGDPALADAALIASGMPRTRSR